MDVRILGVSLACAVAILTLGSSASYALEPGVHVDPGSPAAKEYALPLNEARATGVHGSGSKGDSGTSFGAGIKPGSGGPKDPGSRPGASGAGGSSTSTKGALSRLSVPSALPAAVLRSETSHASSDGNGSILVLLGAGVAILVLSGFVGMVLRRNRPSAPVH